MLHLTDLGDLGDLADASGYKQMWKNPGFPGKSSTGGFSKPEFSGGYFVDRKKLLLRDDILALCHAV